jgi:hypothetical protein
MEMIELIQHGLDSAKRVLDRKLEGLTDAELKWQPRPDSNSIGLILFHVVRVEDIIMQRIQDKPQLWESGKWYQKFDKTVTDGGAHYTAGQVAGFVVPDLKELLAYALAVRKHTLEYLKQLKPTDFDRKVNLPPPPASVVTPSGSATSPQPPVNPVVGSELMHLVTELAGHAGEISYIRGLQRGLDK